MAVQGTTMFVVFRWWQRCKASCRPPLHIPCHLQSSPTGAKFCGGGATCRPVWRKLKIWQEVQFLKKTVDTKLWPKPQLQLKALCACQLVTKCLWLLKTSDMCTKITAILGKATGSSKINSNVIVGGSFGPLNLLNALLVFIGFNLLNSSYLSASACVLYTFFCCWWLEMNCTTIYLTLWYLLLIILIIRLHLFSLWLLYFVLCG